LKRFATRIDTPTTNSNIDMSSSQSFCSSLSQSNSLIQTNLAPSVSYRNKSGEVLESHRAWVGNTTKFTHRNHTSSCFDDQKAMGNSLPPLPMEEGRKQERNDQDVLGSHSTPSHSLVLYRVVYCFQFFYHRALHVVINRRFFLT